MVERGDGDDDVVVFGRGFGGSRHGLLIWVGKQ